MKAIVRHTYGSPDVLQFTEVETPTPKDDGQTTTPTAPYTTADPTVPNDDQLQPDQHACRTTTRGQPSSPS